MRRAPTIAQLGAEEAVVRGAHETSTSALRIAALDALRRLAGRGVAGAERALAAMPRTEAPRPAS